MGLLFFSSTLFYETEETNKPSSNTRPCFSCSPVHPASHNSPLQCLACEVPDVCIPILLQCPKHRDNCGLDQLLAVVPALAAIIEERPDDFERLGDVEADIRDGIGGKAYNRLEHIVSDGFKRQGWDDRLYSVRVSTFTPRTGREMRR